MLIMRKLSNFFNLGTSSAKPIEDFLEVSSVLHGYDSQLIFFIHPYQECLIIVMENSSTIGPVSIQTYSFQESITFLEKEVIINQLLSLYF